MSGSTRRDIVCVGAADGRALPIARLVSQLPEDFPAAVFIVSTRGSSALAPSILASCAALPVAEASHDEPIACGRIRVAPPGRQLRLTATTTELDDVRGEQRVRPGVDALFRSAAASLGRRVVGVVLGGEGREGSDGVRAIHSCGGLVVVAATTLAFGEPATQLYRADYVLPLEDMGALLVRLTAHPPTASGAFLRCEREPLERGNLVLAVDRVAVTELLVEAVAGAQLVARRKAVQLRCVWDPGVTVVLADRRRLRQVLANLLDETIDLTPRGGAVVLSAEVGAGEVRFCVADTGPESTLEEREHVLDDAVSAAREPGDADPSSEVREFVEAQGGRIWIDSDGATGTAFYFTLPSLPCVISRADAAWT